MVSDPRNHFSYRSSIRLAVRGYKVWMIQRAQIAVFLSVAAFLIGAKPLSAADLPSPDLTPGSVFRVTANDVCRPGYTRSVRHVSSTTKRQVYLEYGISSHRSGDYEIDHLISLELGGSNDIKNLWPQSLQTHPWNAHRKDRLEDKLHAMVCSGQISLEMAQRAIATNWIVTYRRYVDHEDKDWHLRDR